jgi:predicted dithiol-disulfide oxidoreductase (DUF899 family)
MTKHKVVSPKQWLTARKALLVKEKKFTRARDQLSENRRGLPWVKIDKEYVFDGPAGKKPYRNCLTVEASSSSIISCLPLIGTPGASTVRSGQIISMTSSCI